MGLNAYLTYSVCLTLNVSWQQALSASFVGGALLTLLCCLGVVDLVVQRVLPVHLKMSITVAIGVFQALIGLENMGLVVGASDTLVTLGDVAPTWDNAPVYIGVFGLLLIATLLIVAKWNGSMLIGIMFMACTSWVMKLTPAPVTMFNAPTWSSFCQIDFSGWNPARPEFPGLLVSSVVILFVCLFDVAGVQHGLQDACGLSDSPSRNTRVIGTTGIGTMIGAVLGTSPLLVAVESSSAIVEGARTGLASIVMAALFSVSLSISPVLDAMPRVATAVPLIVVGAFMMGPCGKIAWGNLRVALPAFLTITFVPFTYSIHNGVLAGLLMEMYLVGMGRTCGVTMDAEENDENVENGSYATPMHASPQSFYRLSSCTTTPSASNLSTPRGRRK
jgi:AGZA family xanthine/uracil permease-like MFS transporter